MTKITLGITATALLLHAGVFDAGTKSVALTVGTGSGFDSTYTIVGVSANYFAFNGLSVGVGYRGWFGGTPTMNEVDLPVTYYLPLSPTFRPYAGVFYRHTFISGHYDDYETVGARAGIAYAEGRAYLSVGWAEEWYSRSNGDTIRRGYPEITAAISF
ncbi:hypothetical protein WCX72_02080 [Sulfurimonas sp. HSL1-6]|uniref:hypothetical protein n=1 Tax=Thiomicrolovo immobilis TaxID=3131935 RepID=UPI0031F903DE